jgi:hypothetical protein
MVDSVTYRHNTPVVGRIEGEPNGFLDRSDCTLSWDDGTRTLTLTGTYTIWSTGLEFEKTGDSFQIGDVEGAHFVYYDETGTLAETPTFTIDLVSNYCLVAYVTWDATNNEAVPGVVNEQHGMSMSSDTHAYLHTTVGAAYDEGLALTIVNSDGSGDDDDHARFSSAAGQTRDEDITHTIAAHGTTDNLPVLWRDGANGDWRMAATDEFAVIKGTSRAYWNEWTGATWQRTEAAQNDFVLAHLFAVPGLTPATGYIVSVMGQAEYGSQGDARAGAETELFALQLAGLPSAEFLAVGSIIFQTGTGNSNAVASRIRTTDSGDDYVDWRFVRTGVGGASASVAWGDISGTLTDQADLIAGNLPYDNSTSGLTATQVQAAIDEIEARIEALEP